MADAMTPKQLDWQYDTMADNGVWRAETPFGAYELWEAGDGLFWWQFQDFGRHSEPTSELAMEAAQSDFNARCVELWS